MATPSFLPSIAIAMAPLLLLVSLLLATSAAAQSAGRLVVLRADRRVDLSSQVVRVSTSVKVENSGADEVSDVVLALSSGQAKRVAFMQVYLKEGKSKSAASLVPLAVTSVAEQVGVTLYSVTLPRALKKGEGIALETYVVLTHVLKPYPEEISQADVQLVMFHDNAYFLSPYPVKAQSSMFKLPSFHVESFSRVEPTKVVDSDVRYGPYENVGPLASQPIALHFENNQPFAVATELVREIEISHWGNVYVTEHYRLAHMGARLTGSFSRFDLQSKPSTSGTASFRHLLARLPPHAHSVYYRDEIGNISTSHLRSDFRKTELELEPRYPLFGGWKVMFTLGYSVPLQDFVFKSIDGSRFLNISFGCPFNNVVVDNLIVKVVLPEGSHDLSVTVPFAVEQRKEIKHSYLDTVGRNVAVLTKQNAVAEHHSMFFQVYYRFNPIAMLVEPLLLVIGFLAFFGVCITYTHFDFALSTSAKSYQAQLQREEVVDVIQRLLKVMGVRTAAGDRLEASLREVARSGDTAPCKSARKAADATWKETSKDLKTFSDTLHASVCSPSVLAKVESLLHKEKEMVEKLQQKQTATIDAYERKLSSKDIDVRIAPLQEKLDILRQEVNDLFLTLDD